MRQPVQEVRCAIKWIDDPAMAIIFALYYAKFFQKHAEFWMRLC